MVVEFCWDNVQKSTMRFNVSKGWNWNDLHKNLARATLWLDQVEHTVDLLIDLRGYPLPSGAVGHLRSLGKTQHRNASGRVVIIGVPDAVVSAITPSADQIYRVENRVIAFVKDTDTAQGLIAGWQSSETAVGSGEDPSNDPQIS